MTSPKGVYALDHAREFQRLEEQASSPGYEASRDLAGLAIPASGRILDAGCGSGAVTRFLGEMAPGARVTGCDASAERLAAAAAAAKGIPNVSFQTADLRDLPFGVASFQFAVCRYVLQHLTPGERAKALQGLFRCLAPGGLLCVVDMDGGFHNIHPRSRRVEDGLAALENCRQVDLLVGRKLPLLLLEAGFSGVTFRVETLAFQAGTEAMRTEARLVAARFENALPFFAKVLGSEASAAAFRDDYLAGLERPGTALFYNKFIATGVRSPLRLVG